MKPNSKKTQKITAVTAESLVESTQPESTQANAVTPTKTDAPALGAKSKSGVRRSTRATQAALNPTGSMAPALQAHEVTQPKITSDVAARPQSSNDSQNEPSQESKASPIASGTQSTPARVSKRTTKSTLKTSQNADTSTNQNASQNTNKNNHSSTPINSKPPIMDNDLNEDHTKPNTRRTKTNQQAGALLTPRTTATKATPPSAQMTETDLSNTTQNTGVTPTAVPQVKPNQKPQSTNQRSTKRSAAQNAAALESPTTSTLQTEPEKSPITAHQTNQTSQHPSKSEVSKKVINTAPTTPQRPLGTRIDKQAGLPKLADIYEVIHTHAVVFKRPLSQIALAQELEIPPTKASGLQTLVEQLANAGDIRIAPKGALLPASEEPMVRGVLQVHKEGYGFVLNPEGVDLFVNERTMNGAWHGDHVAARVTGIARNGKREGAIIAVTERRFTQIVGHLIQEKGVWLVNPDDVRLRADILVDAAHLMGAQANQVVVVALTEYGGPYMMPQGKIVEVLGNADDAGMEVEIAVRKFEIPHTFSEATLRQTEGLPDTVTTADHAARIDLRDVPLVTIDGEDARDFDDAVYCEPMYQGKTLTGYRLLVAIADVSHYVKDKSALNEDAILRATSVYFPRRVVPMLPEKLSNGLCSLNPHVDRLCMVADMVIGLDGNVAAYQFYPAIMHSAARLTYNQVWEFLSEGTGVLTQEHHAVAEHITHLYALFQCQLAARAVRGAMEFETTETYIISDEMGKIQEILPRTRNDAHRIIEECMLCANVCAAEFIESNLRSSLYRVHEGPTPEKLETLRKNLALAGLRMGGGDKPSPQDYAQVMQLIHERPDAQILQTLLLRSMQQAVYAPDNQGHFGLAYTAYTHFTSPIRRYPDLLVHRTIKSILLGQRYTPITEGISLLEDTRKKVPVVDAAHKAVQQGQPQKDANQLTWTRLGEHASMCERRADEASRDVTAWLKCEYMKQYLGEIMPGTISSVTQFGAFVTLNDVFVDGLIHISELGQDYFEFDEASFSLKGRTSGQTYRLGDSVAVRIAAVDSESRKIDFILDHGDAERPTSKGKARRSKPKLDNEPSNQLNQSKPTRRSTRKKR